MNEVKIMSKENNGITLDDIFAIAADVTNQAEAYDTAKSYIRKINILKEHNVPEDRIKTILGIDDELYNEILNFNKNIKKLNDIIDENIEKMNKEIDKCCTDENTDSPYPVVCPCIDSDFNCDNCPQTSDCTLCKIKQAKADENEIERTAIDNLFRDAKECADYGLDIESITDVTKIPEAFLIAAGICPFELKKFAVPIKWQLRSYAIVNAISAQDAIEIVKQSIDTPPTDGTYVKNSLQCSSTPEIVKEATERYDTIHRLESAPVITTEQHPFTKYNVLDVVYQGYLEDKKSDNSNDCDCTESNAGTTTDE